MAYDVGLNRQLCIHTYVLYLEAQVCANYSNRAICVLLRLQTDLRVETAVIGFSALVPNVCQKEVMAVRKCGVSAELPRWESETNEMGKHRCLFQMGHVGFIRAVQASAAPRVGGYWFDDAEEPLEAVEDWRSGEGEVAECPSRDRGAER